MLQCFKPVFNLNFTSNSQPGDMVTSNPAPLNYRLAVPSDAQDLAALINAAFRSEKTGQTWLYDSQDKRIDIVNEKLMLDFINGSDTVMIVGTPSGPTSSSVVATCYLRRPSSSVSPGSHQSLNFAWLGFLAVSPSRHGSGYGASTLTEAERFVSEEWNSPGLELDFVHTRTELRAWYEKRGYVATGSSREFFYTEEGRKILREGLMMIVLQKRFDS